MKRLVVSITLLLALIIATFFIKSAYAAEIPQYKGYVNDYADVLKPEEELALSQKLQAEDKKTTNQIAVVTIKTLDGEAIEEYSINLAEEWKVGQKGKDNGVIMLFAMEDRKMRIEVGRGLEGNLTDIESKHILDDTIRPEFREERYFDGINKGTDAVILAIGTEYAPTEEAGSDNLAIIILIIGGIIIIGVVILIVVAESPYSPLGGSGSWGISNTWGSGSSILSSSNDSDSDGFGGFGGGSFSGGGASSSW